ncbi:MAG TPA: hypothetical protein VK175_06440 [Leadbetterella sp.]|nr:hypothetical protein [Leadbetterella sp.]
MEKKYFIYKFNIDPYKGKVYEMVNSFFDLYQDDDDEKTLIFAGINQDGKADFFKYSDIVFISQDEYQVYLKQ